MTKILSCLLVFLLLFAMFSCSGKGSNSSSGETEDVYISAPEESTETINSEEINNSSSETEADDEIKDGSEAESSSEPSKAPEKEPVKEPVKEYYGFNIGDKLMPVAFPGLDGAPLFKSADYKGKVMVINFWAYWCGYCISEFPDIERLAEEDDDIVVLALHYGTYPEGFLKQSGWDDWKINFALDTPQSNAEKLYTTLSKATVIPVTVIIDADGVITYRHAGALGYSDLKKAVNDAKNK